MDPSTMYLTAFLIIGGIIFLVLFFHYVPFFLWLSAKVSGVNISLVQLFLMRIRNVPPYIIVPGMIEAHKAGYGGCTDCAGNASEAFPRRSVWPGRRPARKI